MNSAMAKQQESENKDRTSLSLKETNDFNESPPPIQSSNGTCTNLQEMMEDCLREIFKVKTLDTMDLCSIAETCKQFREIAQSIIPKTMILRAEARFGQYSIGADGEEEYVSRRDIERIFENFGSSLSHVAVQNDFYLLDLVGRYCDGDKLEGLTLTGFVNGLIHSNIHFKQLKVLKLDLCVRRPALHSFCALVALNVHFVKRSGTILQHTFPNLERFEYMTYESITLNNPLLPDSLDNLPTFISRHNTLKSLKLQFDSDDKSSLYFLKAISESCKNLEELSLQIQNVSDNSLQSLTKLKSLRTLSLHFVNFENFKFLSTLTNLRELHLHVCRLPKEPDHFVCLAQLTKLEFHYCYKSIDIAGIISRLTNLEEMTIKDVKSNFVLEKHTFLKIADIVTRRLQVLTLKCFYGFPLMRDHEKLKVKLLPSHYANLCSEVD